MNRGAEGTPFALEAEQAIVSALFSEQAEEAFNRLVLVVRADDFYIAAHAAVFRAFAALVEAGVRPDSATVSARVKSTVTMDDGVKTVLADAASFPFVLANIEQYGQLVAEKAMGRRIASGLQEVAKKAGLVGGELSATDLLREVDALAQSEYRETRGNQILEAPDAALQATLQWLEDKNNGKVVGISTGIGALDDFLGGGIMAPDLVVVAGRPSMGKTAMALTVALNAGLPRGVDEPPEGFPLVAVFSMEMGTEQITLRNLSNLGSIDHDRLRKAAMTDEDYSRLSFAVSRYAASNIRIDCDPYVSPAIMRAKLRLLKNRTQKPIAAIVVDYMQLMQPDRMMQNKATEVGEISRSLKLLAKEFEAPVIALSQLNRKVEERPNKRPTMADLRESGGIEQDADTIIMLYRDEYYNPDTDMKGITELIIPKNRNGKTGTVPAAFIGEYQRFADIGGGRASWEG